ncbi:MAG: F0F1 ATP synthase subunit alpha, partial [Muribaculaceae bacterium]|nr:F0F1 ATP synthase subunit alpha [Muribaculaceae bacterium]
EVCVIFCGVNGLLTNVPVDQVADFDRSLIQLLRANYQSDVLDAIREKRVLTDEISQKITDAAKEVAAKYN